MFIMQNKNGQKMGKKTCLNMLGFEILLDPTVAEYSSLDSQTKKCLKKKPAGIKACPPILPYSWKRIPIYDPLLMWNCRCSIVFYTYFLWFCWASHVPPPTLPGINDTQPWIHTTRNGHGGQVAVGTKNLQPTGCCLGIWSEIYKICTYDHI